MEKLDVKTMGMILGDRIVYALEHVLFAGLVVLLLRYTVHLVMTWWKTV